MKLPNLAKLPFDTLIELRDEAEALIKKQAKSQRQMLEKQLANVSRFFADMAPGSGKKRGRPAGKKSLAGKRVPPKYRNPKNHSETWAGRGMQPRWMRDRLKQGATMEEFLIAPAKHEPKPGSKRKAAKATVA
jgi:DNA-binding protein H-NS